MSVFLLDANVLISLAWPDHEFHKRALSWFGRKCRNGWATCPITQSAFVRILSNPAFSAKALTPQNALGALEVNLQLAGHQFWPADISLSEVFQRVDRRIVSHRQITGAYLLALAAHHHGQLATMDQSIQSLGKGIELIPLD